MALEQFPSNYDLCVEADPMQQLTEVLDEYQERLEAESHILDNAPRGQYSPSNPPAGWYERSRICAEAVDLLQRVNYEPTQLSRFAWLQDCALFNNCQLGYESVDLLANLRDLQIPRSNLIAAFDAEPPNGLLHHIILADMQTYAVAPNSANLDAVARCVYFLRDAYRVQRPTDLLRASNDPYAEKVRDHLLRIGGMQTLYEVEVDARPEQSCDEDGIPNGELAQKQRDWLRNVIMRSTAITDPYMADNYAYTLARKNLHDGRAVVQLVNAMESLGDQRLALLRNFAGIYALNDYKPDQLERMIKVAQGDEREIARLQGMDVIVAVVNRMGDHNGAFASMRELVDDPQQRTLYFEMQTAGDMYRVMSRVNERGIKPSTLICAAHGEPGYIHIVSKPPIGEAVGHTDLITVNTPDYAAHVNQSREDDGKRKDYALCNLNGFVYLVEKYMQDSRGINDDRNSLNKRKIILIACDAATSSGVRAINPKGNDVIEVGRVSIVDRIAYVMASVMASHDEQPEVLIYGAPVSFVPTKNQVGIACLAHDNQKNLRPHDARKVSIANGAVQDSHLVPVMPLRNPN